MSRLQSLKQYINQRLTAAVEDIFEHFERTITEYEEEMDLRHRKLCELDSRTEVHLQTEAGTFLSPVGNMLSDNALRAKLTLA